MYVRGVREKYWFAYRKNPLKDIENCEEKYIVYGCKDANNIIILPVNEIESKLDKLNVSRDKEGNITHWHIEFFKDKCGKIIWRQSKPNIEEIDISKYKLKN